MKLSDRLFTSYVIVGIILFLVIGYGTYTNRVMWDLALSLLLLSALIMVGVHRFLVRPIRALEQEIETITQTGDLDRKITIESDDEIGQLAVSFNDMTKSLRRSRDELELKVAERTTELANTSAVLKQEIAERKRTEETLRQAKQAAQAAVRAKNILLANMGHEFRTPLNAILGFSELMSHDLNLTAEQRDYLLTIERSGKQLLALVDDVLELAEIEAGRVTLQDNNFDLHYTLMGIEELFSPRAKAKGVTLAFEHAPDVPQYVRMDQGKLCQVLINLLGNAIKFTGKGDITLQVSRLDKSSGRAPIKGGGNSRFGYLPTCYLEFRVRDTGIDISSEELNSIFDVFVQIPSGKLSCRGAGLGMPISHRFVRMMGGDLTVSGESEQEAVFKFDVPVGITDAGRVHAYHLERRVIGLEPGQPVYRLLIVDDIEQNREWLVNLLQPFADPSGNHGFEMREAANGQEAIEIWEEWDPHLIWMDIQMPILDGRKAARYIKAASESIASRSAPIIIALITCGLEEERELARVMRCANLVRKPLYEVEVLDVLAKYLGVRFIYAGDRAEKEAESLQDALMALTPNWLADLRQATVAGDLGGMTALIEQIRAPHPALAAKLTRLVYDFEHDAILDLIRQAVQD
jgi:signal transduction histidine kinase/CheY-like chemotaxis protein